MGDAFYQKLVLWFTNPLNHHMTADSIVSSALSDLGSAAAYIWLAFTLLWLASKSVLLRRAQVVNLLAGMFILGAIDHIGNLLHFPLYFQYIIDFFTAVIALITASVFWSKKHLFLNTVYQFKYVIGLLKTLERLDEVSGDKK